MDFHESLLIDRRAKYPQAVRDALAHLFREGASAKDAADAVGVPTLYAHSRLQLFRARALKSVALAAIAKEKANV